MLAIKKGNNIIDFRTHGGHVVVVAVAVISQFEMQTKQKLQQQYFQYFRKGFHTVQLDAFFESHHTQIFIPLPYSLVARTRNCHFDWIRFDSQQSVFLERETKKSAQMLPLLLLLLLPLSSIIVVRETILFVSRMHKIIVTYMYTHNFIYIYIYILCVTSVDDPKYPVLGGEYYVIACFL